jgi:hypothetical protein
MNGVKLLKLPMVPTLSAPRFAPKDSVTKYVAGCRTVPNAKHRSVIAEITRPQSFPFSMATTSVANGTQTKHPTAAAPRLRTLVHILIAMLANLVPHYRSTPCPSAAVHQPYNHTTKRAGRNKCRSIGIKPPLHTTIDFKLHQSFHNQKGA